MEHKRYLPKLELIKRYLLILGIITAVSFSVIYFYLLPSVLWWLSLFLAFNLGSFAMFGYDKMMSTYENMPRLPERFFHIVASIGGSLGIVVGIYAFRHKTKKISFSWKVFAILLIQFAVLGYIYDRFFS
jgi:uncharacterized membrane protein YsdA (DUF1294 family)